MQVEWKENTPWHAPLFVKMEKRSYWIMQKSNMQLLFFLIIKINPHQSQMK